MKIAIICVAYNRVNSLKRLLASLDAASYPEEVTLIISIDKSKTDVVEKFADAYDWKHGNKRVAKHSENLGLRKHMLSLGNYFDEFDALIVLEDDVTIAPSFFHYAKACIEKYQDDENIAGISLYNFSVNYQNHLPFSAAKSNYDVYLMQCAQSWGEVWMKRSWLEFKAWYDTHNEDFNLEYIPSNINRWPKTSWLKYHTRYCIEENKYFVYPYYALSTNNGDVGVNFDTPDTLFQSELQLFLKKDYTLPSSAECPVYYDGFMEAAYLGDALGISNQELSVDIYGNKPSCLYKRYVLSSRSLPYKTVKAFALQHRPFEANIFANAEGNDIWLYDTTIAAPSPKGNDRYAMYYYLFKKGFYKALTIIGPARIASLLWRLVVDKIKK